MCRHALEVWEVAGVPHARGGGRECLSTGEPRARLRGPGCLRGLLAPAQHQQPVPSRALPTCLGTASAWASQPSG